MAKYKPSAILGQIKGSIGSTTFQGGNVSSIIRHRGYKRGSSSIARSTQTSLLVQITTVWKTLSSTQQRAWANAALLYPFVDKFGTTYFASGYQCYTAYNNILQQVGIDVVNTPNIVTTPINVGPFDVNTLTSTKVVLEWTGTSPVGLRLMVFATSGVSPGRNLNNAKYRYIGYWDIATLSNYDFFHYYNNVFGAPLTGTQIIFKVFSVAPSYGFKYFPNTFSGIVA